MAEYKTTIEKTDKGTRIRSGNMTDEHVARLAAERERTKDMDVDDAAKAGQDSLEKAIQAKKRFTEMQNMLDLDHWYHQLNHHFANHRHPAYTRFCLQNY